MAIEDGASYFHSEQATVVRHHPAWSRVAHLVPPIDQPVAAVTPLAARVNHGRWIVDCPDCNGAEFVWLDAPRQWCVGCRNAAVGGRWRPVKVPTERQREAIAAALGARPNPATRNWTPGETVEMLRAENVAMGSEG